MKIWCIFKSDTAIKWRELLVVEEPSPWPVSLITFFGESPVQFTLDNVENEAIPSEVYWSNGVVRHCKISNLKHQITNKSQIPILNDQNRFGPPEADQVSGVREEKD